MSGSKKGAMIRTDKARSPRAITPPRPTLSPLAREMAEGMDELIDAVREGQPLDKRFTARRVQVLIAATSYGPDEVRGLRERLNASQAVFANFLGVSASAVRAWERSARPVPTIARRFMDEVAADPGLFSRRLEQSAKRA